LHLSHALAGTQRVAREARASAEYWHVSEVVGSKHVLCVQ